MERILDDTYGVAKVQAMLLDVLDEFDGICRKNHIHYSLHGGTLLGAERNHHLIPWDDDIDVSMVQSEYDRFKRAIPKDADACHLDETTMWFPRFVMCVNGEAAYIDILVWNYISENRIAQQCKIYLLAAVQEMLENRTDYERFSFVQRILLKSVRLAGLPLTDAMKHKLYNTIERKFLVGKKKFIHRSNDSYLGKKYIFDRDYMKGYSLLELEGRKYMVSSRYREFLERSYGENYLELPPEKDRVPGHVKFRDALEREFNLGIYENK